MESKDLDKLFKDAFEHAEEAPSNRVWEGIEQKLAKEKKVIPFYVKYRAQLSIAAILLLFFGVGLTFYKMPNPSGHEKTEEVLSAMEKQTVQPNSNTTESEKKSIVETPTNNLGKPVEKQSLASISKEIQIKETSAEVIGNSENYINENSQKEEIVHLENIVASVSADIEINQPFIEEVKTLEPINSGVQPSYALTTQQEEAKSSIVTRVLNGITKNIITKSIDIQENKEIEFRNDEEGSISLNIYNSLARK